MLMDPKKMCEMIRMKKKKMMENPEVVNNDPAPEMNAQDVYDMKQTGRIESTLGTPEKINADDTMADMSQSEAENVGVTEEDKKRMVRLRGYIDTLDL